MLRESARKRRGSGTMRMMTCSRRRMWKRRTTRTDRRILRTTSCSCIAVLGAGLFLSRYDGTAEMVSSQAEPHALVQHAQSPVKAMIGGCVPPDVRSLRLYTTSQYICSSFPVPWLSTPYSTQTLDKLVLESAVFGSIVEEADGVRNAMG